MKRNYLTLSLLLYVACLYFNAYYTDNGGHMSSVWLLVFGLWGIPFEIYGWFANPLFGLALLTHRWFPRVALGLSLLALGLGLWFLRVSTVPDNTPQSYDFVQLTALGVGYYLWIGALALMVLGQALHCRDRREVRQVPRLRIIDWLLLLVVLGVILFNAFPEHGYVFERTHPW